MLNSIGLSLIFRVIEEIWGVPVEYLLNSIGMCLVFGVTENILGFTLSYC